MRMRLRFVCLLAAASTAALAACGPGQQAHAAPRSVNPAPIYHQFAQCIRDHGVPTFPDPTVDDRGRPQLPHDLPQPANESLHHVVQACQGILDQLPQNLRNQLSQSFQPAGQPDVAMMERFAQCMRAHGIADWPDPDSQGRFALSSGLADDMKGGPRLPQIRAAMDGPCRQYDPSGQIEVAQS